MIPSIMQINIWIMAGLTAWFIHIFPGKTLLEGMEAAFGSILGRMAGGWLLTWLFIVNCYITQEFFYFLKISVFPRTPDYAIIALFLLSIAYAVNRGLEVLGRLMVLIIPTVYVFSLLLSFLSFKDFQLNKLTPILADGISPVLKGALYPSIMSCLMVVILFMSTSLKEPKKAGRDIVYSGIMIMFLSGGVETLTSAVLEESKSTTFFPILKVVRTVEIGQFLTRIDTLYVATFIIVFIANMIPLHYALSSGVQKIFRLEDYKPLAWSFAFLVWAGSPFLSTFLEHNIVILFHSGESNCGPQ